jgi:2-polyprenyl-3-methyl-5-hydroxy-6-metoxy-1,4-benzoquinol methylase
MTRVVNALAPRVGLVPVSPETHDIVPKGRYDLVPAGQYDCAPKGQYVMGPADRFLLVPKNRYRLTLLAGQRATDELGVGWVTEENTPEGYDRLWGGAGTVDAYKAEGEGVRERMPHEIVGEVADAVRTARAICDIGCGVGDLLAAARALNPDVAVSGLDFSQAAVDRAKVRFPGADIRRHVIVDTLPFADAAFDVVFCTDVLEHLEHREAAVAELLRLCRPGGLVVIVVPDGDVDQFFGHLWFFNEASLAAFLAPWGARVHRLADCREFMARIVRPEAMA